MRFRHLAAPATALVLVAAMTGCAASDDPAADGTIRIVASTNVYGDLARAVLGDAGEVTSLIEDAAQDPHEYEADGRDALAISRADIVIVNGGGYDEFMHTLLDAQGSDAVVIDAVLLSGLDPDAEVHDHGDEEHADEEHADEDHADEEHAEHEHGEFNEHVWYHFGTMGAVADELAEQLGAVDGGRADEFRDNALAFNEGIQQLVARASDIAAERAGEGVAITEPVPLYLLQAVGLENRTPDEFSEAVEEGTDAPALVLEATIALVTGGQVALLAYNEQTVGPQTEQVLAAAEDAELPVVSFSELLPEGDDYLGWMDANLDAVEAALA